MFVSGEDQGGPCGTPSLPATWQGVSSKGTDTVSALDRAGVQREQEVSTAGNDGRGKGHPHHSPRPVSMSDCLPPVCALPGLIDAVDFFIEGMFRSFLRDLSGQGSPHAYSVPSLLETSSEQLNQGLEARAGCGQEPVLPVFSLGCSSSPSPSHTGPPSRS